MSVCEQRGGGEERKCSIIQEATGGSTWPCSRENKGSDPHCVFTFHDNTAHPQAYIAEERNGQMVFTGNRTECALLLLTRAWGLDFRDIREEMDERLHQVGGQAGVGTSGRRWTRGCTRWGVRQGSGHQGGDGRQAAPGGGDQAGVRTSGRRWTRSCTRWGGQARCTRWGMKAGGGDRQGCRGWGG